MNNNHLICIVDKYKRYLIKKYPKYLEYTENNFKIIENMLSEDYDSLSSNRKIRLFKSYLSALIEKSFINNGIKNYMIDTLKVFYDSEIAAFLLSTFKNNRNDFTQMMTSLKYEITYWQGCEELEDIKLNRLLNIVK